MTRKGSLFLALVVAALTLGVLWHLHRPPVVKEATMAEVQAEAARGGYRLIGTEELAKICQQPPAGFLLVDTRQLWEYQSGYIQGAVNFPMEPTWWCRWRSQAPLAKLLGPDKARLIVFYCAGLA